MRRMASLLFHETNYQKVLETIIHGGKIAWMQTPWKNHVEEYLETRCLVIRYEDMIKQPIIESNRILQFLGGDFSPEHVSEIVTKHSFKKRKEHFKRSGNSQAFNFLRKGKPGEWKEKLTEVQLTAITKELGPIMKKMGYL